MLANFLSPFYHGDIVPASIKDDVDALKRKNLTLEKRLALVEKALEIAQEPQNLPEPPPKKEATHFETAVGMKWFGRIGILALAIGIGLFIKYAFDNNWVGLSARIIIGIVIAVTLLVVGEVFSTRKHYENWAQTLMGGGIAIGYFAIYASYHFPAYRA